MTDGTTEGLAQAIGARDDDDAMLREVLDGLRRPDKRIASKFHYDTRGSELFEQITRLEEYYPTRTERALLEQLMPGWVAELRPAALVELGAGSASKSRVALDAMVAVDSGRAYVPVDVSHDFLRETAAAVRAEYPTLEVTPVVGDLTAALDVPHDLPSPAWIAFLGSTIGNFEEPAAIELLRRVRARLRPDDRFLLGVDLRPGPNKAVARIERAYDDAPGITAAFSLNLLHVLNDQLGADFDTSAFRHRSYYHAERGRVETYLVATRDMTVTFPDGTEIAIARDEAIRTEVSCKYDRPTVDRLFAAAGLAVERWAEDERAYYALVLGRAA
jgi:L-histidine N-alpha-methyltransferase